MEAKKHSISLRVRYAETDQMGVVYHGNYAQYFEVARVEFLRHLGKSYAELEKEGLALPVLELNVKFIRPVFYDDELTISTECSKITGSRITFISTASKNEEVTTIGTVTLVFLNLSTKKPMRCPEEFSALFGVVNND
ncbi:MAG: acyl-CoA thioester hydrolase [Luteibaculaceae bacterium]|jgi:acyl-CoA thioester hydrolase